MVELYYLRGGRVMFVRMSLCSSSLVVVWCRISLQRRRLASTDDCLSPQAQVTLPISFCSTGEAGSGDRQEGRRETLSGGTCYMHLCKAHLMPPIQFPPPLVLTLFKVYTVLQLMPNLSWNFCSYKIVLTPSFVVARTPYPRFTTGLHLHLYFSFSSSVHWHQHQPSNLS